MFNYLESETGESMPFCCEAFASFTILNKSTPILLLFHYEG